MKRLGFWILNLWLVQGAVSFASDIIEDPLTRELFETLQNLESRLPSSAQALSCPANRLWRLPQISIEPVSAPLMREREESLKALLDWNQQILTRFDIISRHLTGLQEQHENLSTRIAEAARLREEVETEETRLEQIQNTQNFLLRFDTEEDKFDRLIHETSLEQQTFKSVPLANLHDLRIEIRKIVLSELKKPNGIGGLISSEERSIILSYPIDRDETALDQVLENLAQKFENQSVLKISQSKLVVLLNLFIQGVALEKKRAEVLAKLNKWEQEKKAHRDRLFEILGIKNFRGFVTEGTVAEDLKKKLVAIESEELPRQKKRIETAKTNERDFYSKSSSDLQNLADLRRALEGVGKEIAGEEAQVQNLWADYLQKREELVQGIQKTGVAIEAYRHTHPIFPRLIMLKSESKLTDLQRRVWEELQSGAGVDFDLLSQAFLEAETFHYNNGQPLTEEVQSKLDQSLNTLRREAPARTQLSLLKTYYEKGLEKIWGRPGVYNKDRVTVLDVLLDGRLQCLSGTKCFHLFLRRRLEAKGYHDQNLVMILTPGHILPGQMVKNDQGEWVLFGYESTSAGTGIVPFGKAAELAGPIRVVDPELFFLREVFRDVVVDMVPISQQMLQVAAERYGIQLSKFETPAESDAFEKDNTSKRLPDPVAFGQIVMPEGDISRLESDWVDPNQLLKGHVVPGDESEVSNQLKAMGASYRVLLAAGISKDPSPMTDAQFNEDFLRFRRSLNIEKFLQANKLAPDAFAWETLPENFDEILKLANDRLAAEESPDALNQRVQVLYARGLMASYFEALFAGHLGTEVAVQQNSGATRYPIEEVMKRLNYLETQLKKFPQVVGYLWPDVYKSLERLPGPMDPAFWESLERIFEGSTFDFFFEIQNLERNAIIDGYLQKAVDQYFPPEVRKEKGEIE